MCRAETRASYEAGSHVGVEKAEKDWRRGRLLVAITSLRDQEVVKMGAVVRQASGHENVGRCHTGLICRWLLLH